MIIKIKKDQEEVLLIHFRQKILLIIIIIGNLINHKIAEEVINTKLFLLEIAST